MELYHLHTKGIKNNVWKEKKEIRIDDSFQNRLGKLVNNFSTVNNSTNLSELENIHNNVLISNGYSSQDKFNLEDLIDAFNYMYTVNPSLKKYAYELLKEARETILKASVFKREMAMEQFRKDNNIELPSRMHCLYALDEDSLDYWKNNLRDGDLELFRIDAMDVVFKTSEQFIPMEQLDYKTFYDASYSYWNPNLSKVKSSSCEYLIKGKVKILEKLDEFKK